MKRNFIFLMAFILIAPFLFTSKTNGEPPFTGNDWVKLRKLEKVQEVKASIKALRTQGVIVKLDPIFYCKRLDRVYVKHPNLKKEEVAKTLKTSMIMEYDWEEKGVDKETLAKQWLGEELYQKNKARRERGK